MAKRCIDMLSRLRHHRARACERKIFNRGSYRITGRWGEEQYNLKKEKPVLKNPQYCRKKPTLQTKPGVNQHKIIV